MSDTGPGDAAGMIEVASLSARLAAEAQGRLGTVMAVPGAAHRWQVLHAFEATHELAKDAHRQLNAARWEAFDTLTRTPARNLAELVRKLAVLHTAWRADPAASDPCTPELALLGSILADAVALAGEATR